MQDSDSDDKTRSYLQLLNDTIVGHYRIIEKIGVGGMGEVYLAEDTELDRKVALKFLPAHLYQDEDYRKRFKREAQAAAKLNHPNIVTIYEVGEFKDRPFIAMENVEGQTIRDFCKGKERPLIRIIELAIQVCEGLSKAHSAGIVHRDIKPSNILIDQDGRAKIVDFGLATVHGSEHLTKTGSTLGTVGYMSPEQVDGERVDARSDLFSFGVVLYELITGRSPFRAESEIATIRNVIEAVPEPLARYKSDTPDELQRIVDKLLSKDRSLRHQHADELSTDLKRLISTVSSAPPPIRQKRRVVIPSLVILGVLVAILFVNPWRMVMKRGAETRAATRRVAVMPFKNQTGDTSLDPLGKIVVDWTIQSLLQTGLVEVVQPNNVPVSDVNKDVCESAAAAGAGTIIVGSYYLIGDSVQFQSQVMSTDRGFLQAIDPTCVARENVMEGVELARQRILGALMFVVDLRLEGWAAPISKPPTHEAYLQYMQGLDLFDVKLEYAASIPYFTRAYTLDTTFILLLIHLGIAYLNLGQNTLSDSVFSLLELRRTRLSPFAQLMLDENRAFLAGDMMRALAAARAEVKLVPSSKWFYNLAWVAVRVNHAKEAIEALKHVDPDQIWIFYWSLLPEAYHMLGEHEKELETAREGRHRFPASSVTYFAELYALAALDRKTELRELLDEQASLRDVGTPAGVRRSMAEELRAHGHEDQAMVLLDEAINWYEGQALKRLDSLRESYAKTLYFARRWDKAKLVYEELLETSSKYSAAGRRYEAILGTIAARQGDRKRALEVSDWLKDLRVPYLRGSNTYKMACIAAILGDKEQAVSLLKESFLQGQAFGIGIHQDFDLESLWNYPPFIELLKPKG